MPKYANRAADKLLNVADELGERDGVRSRLAQVITSLSGEALDGTGIGGLAAKAVTLPLQAGVTAFDLLGSGVGKVIQPSGKAMKRVNDAAKHLPGGKILDKAGIPVLPVAILGGGGAALTAAAQSGGGIGYTGKRLNDAQSLGETPMSDPFHSFVQKRRHRPLNKVAGIGGGVSKLLAAMAGNIASKPKAMAETLDVVKGLSRRGMGAGLGIGAGVAGALTIADMLDGPTDSLGYKIDKALYPLSDRVQAPDTFATSFLQQTGKNTADILNDVLREAGTQAFDGAMGLPNARQQNKSFTNLMQSDEYLTEASKAEKDMLSRAFQTMRRFAPELASDEFAVKNYLRESLMASNGPDYATISNLARSNRDITDRGRR